MPSLGLLGSLWHDGLPGRYTAVQNASEIAYGLARQNQWYDRSSYSFETFGYHFGVHLPHWPWRRVKKFLFATYPGVDRAAGHRPTASHGQRAVGILGP